MITRNARPVLTASAGAFVLSIGIGYAAMASDEGGRTPTNTVTYDHTPDGRTIGKLPDSDAPLDQSDFPDLVAVVATNGRTGYVESRQLQSPRFHSPEEALKWQENAPAYREIPVYDGDGTTLIGTFRIDGPATGDSKSDTGQ